MTMPAWMTTNLQPPGPPSQGELMIGRRLYTLLRTVRTADCHMTDHDTFEVLKLQTAGRMMMQVECITVKQGCGMETPKSCTGGMNALQQH